MSGRLTYVADMLLLHDLDECMRWIALRKVAARRWG
jgi:hypothetical protein